MSRALEKEFGVAPDLDIEAQRAILVLDKPMRLDWKRVADLIGGASYTFGGAHVRARGRLRRSTGGGTEFEFAGTGQVMPVEGDIESSQGEVEIVARVEGWEAGPRLLLLESK